MSSYKKFLIITIFILFISATNSSSINVNISKKSSDSDSYNLGLESYESNNENVKIHMFCYIKSGNVEHRNLTGPFFGIPIVIKSDIRHFGIGSFYIHLKGGGVRLTVYEIFRKTTYKEDINVSIKGFIGMVQPTGGLSDGFLSGYSLITSIIPLENQ
jgi:hypothetical protein